MKSNIISNGNTNYKIYAENNQTVIFAAKELSEYMYKIAGVTIPVVDNIESGSKHIILGTDTFVKQIFNNRFNTEGLIYDGFMIKADQGNIIFCSKYPRGVLYAVYDFLEHIGCSFVNAVRTSERIPSKSTVTFTKEIISNPFLEERGMTESPNKLNEEWRTNFIRIIDLAVKNKINQFYLGVGDDLNGFLKPVADELTKRGVIIEIGSHGLQNYIPKELIDTKPELFREVDGVRRTDGNICASSDEAAEIIAKRIDDYLSENSAVDVYHGWFEDVIGGSWCSCSKCRDTAPVQQQYNVLCKVAKLVRRNHPHVKLDMLLYHDTIENIGSLDDSANPGNEVQLVGMYAPRERCYAHALNDPACETNKYYLKAVKETVDKFGSDNCCAFEYYADMILFVKTEASLAKIIAEDIKAYKSCGLRKITSLSFEAYSTWAYGLNSYIFARHSWNAELDVKDTLKQYSQSLGFKDNRFISYLNDIQKATVNTFAFCGYGRQYNDIRELPLEPIAFYEKHVNMLKKALGYLKRAEVKLEQLIAENNPLTIEFLKAEKMLLEITYLETEAIFFRMKARYLNKAYPGKYSSARLRGYGRKSIENQRKMQSIIADVPADLKGVIGTITFPGHLCEDQINVMSYIMDNELG